MLRATSMDLSRACSSSLCRSSSALLPAPSGVFSRSKTTSSGGLSPLPAPRCQPQLPERRAARVKARCQPQTAAAGPKDTDPFHAASQRLQNLLSGVGDGDAEMVDSLVSDEAPEARLQMQVVLSGAITATALTISMLCGNDPWGGASMSLDSVIAAGVGITAATPLVLFRAWTWTPQAAQFSPAFEDMHMGQINLQAPWYRGAKPWHVATMMALEVLPITLLLLPAAQGGLMASVELYTMALQSLGAPGPASVETLQFSCLALTAAVAAMTKGLELGISDSEYEVVQAAVDNSERYYRLMAMDVSSRSGSAQRAALAFRSVAEAWMDARNDASSLAMCMCAVDVFALGALWYVTGDLAAPAAAALAINAVDAIQMHKAVAKRDARMSVASTQSSSGPTGNN